MLFTFVTGCNYVCPRCVLLDELAAGPHQDAIDSSRASFENEELTRHEELSSLELAVNEVLMTVAENVPYDGNCFFNTILKLLPHLSHDASSLREALHSYLISSACPNELAALLDIQFLADLCTPFKEVSDDRVVVATAQMLECSITVYTVTSNNTKRSITHGTKLPHIYIGHIEDKHFVPLKPSVNQVHRKRKDSAPVTDSRKKMKFSTMIPEFENTSATAADDSDLSSDFAPEEMCSHAASRDPDLDFEAPFPETISHDEQANPESSADDDSLAEEPDVYPETRGIDYKVLPCTTERGKPRLHDSLGYSYTLKVILLYIIRIYRY